MYKNTYIHEKELEKILVLLIPKLICENLIKTIDL